MATEIKLIVDGRELIVEASSEHLSAVKAAGTSYMRKHEASSGFFTFDGVNYVRHQGERQWHATMAVDVAADIDVDRKDAAAEKEPATVEAVLDIVLDRKTNPYDSLPNAADVDVKEAVVHRKSSFKLHFDNGGDGDILSFDGTLANAIGVMVASGTDSVVVEPDGRPAATVTQADGILVRKALVKKDTHCVPVGSLWKCIATFRKATMSAILTLGTAFYALTAPAPAAACGTWDVAPATHQTVLADGFREHFAYTLPNGEYVEAVGDLLPDRIQCDRALDEDLVKLEAELENARHEAGTVILEKVIGSCEYEQVLDAPRRTARRAR